MPEMISYTLRATYTEVRSYKVIDMICDGVVVFDGFLAEGETASVSSCLAGEGSNGRISFQRSDGPLVIKDVYADSVIDLD